MTGSRALIGGRFARQRGFAMIAVITMFALVGSFMIASGMQRTQAELTNSRDQQTLQALNEAKAALLAYAANTAWTTGDSTDQPGALPCPAGDDIGVQTTCNASASTRIGRIPWSTLGTGELRDSSGQILWYALSANFPKASGTTVINSDTQGTLSVSGDTTGSNLVAVIIAPGQTLDSQIRTAGSGISNYLESTNALQNDSFVTGQTSTTFNDKLIGVTQAELMAAIEPIVAARLERDVKPYLEDYYSEWSAFPYPATFANPSPGTSGSSTTRTQSNYSGSTSESSGLLPVTTSASYSWTTSVGTTVTLTGGTASSISSITCSTINSATPTSSIPFPALQCRFTINSVNSTTICGSLINRHCMINPQFRVSGGIGSNAGISFADLPSVGTVKVTSTGGASRTVSSTLISGSLASSGVGTVRFDATHVYSRYTSSAFTRVLLVTVPNVVVSPFTSGSDSDTGWFIKNEWFRQTYYAVSPGHLPGGGNTCASGGTCLTINNLPSTYATSNDKRAILIFAGRTLVGSTRPSSTLSEYLEGENQTPADRIFAHRTGANVTMNDYVVVVSP